MSSSNKSFQPNQGANSTLIYEFGLVYSHSPRLDASLRQQIDYWLPRKAICCM